MFNQMLHKFFNLPQKKSHNNSPAQDPKPREKHPLDKNVERNKQELQNIFDACGDIVYRDLRLNAGKPVKAFLVYAKTMVDAQTGNDNILGALMSVAPEKLSGDADIPKVIYENLLTNMESSLTADYLELADKVLQGGAALVIDGWSAAIICMITSVKERVIEEPNSEPVVRGPRDGFVEDCKTNISLVRKRIHSTRLKVEFFNVGEVSKTGVALMYLKGTANDKIVEEVRRRINRIKIDIVNESNVIGELIADKKISLFPLVQWTERPDKVAGGLGQGKIAIIVDNTPNVLVVPVSFPSFLQAAEDYYNETVFATFIRLIRFIALNIALLLPGVVVAVMTFHQELIPDKLFMSIANERQGLPFPVFIEVLLMEITFELLREAGARLPRTIGQAVTFVGGLVIGQASIDAGFVGPLPVVTVALTAVASFTIPNYSAGTALRIMRFILIFAAAIMGGIGIVLVLMLLLYHLAGLRSFGVPYLAPLAPWSTKDIKDTFVRAPWWSMITRPKSYFAQDPVRQHSGQGSLKPSDEGDESS